MDQKTLIQAGPGIYIDPLERKRTDPAYTETGKYEVLDDIGLARLCLHRNQMRTILRLEFAGFIKLTRMAPRRYLLNLDSWHAHLKAVEADPDFWSRPEIKRRWKLALNTI